MYMIGKIETKYSDILASQSWPPVHSLIDKLKTYQRLCIQSKTRNTILSLSLKEMHPPPEEKIYFSLCPLCSYIKKKSVKTWESSCLKNYIF